MGQCSWHTLLCPHAFTRQRQGRPQRAINDLLSCPPMPLRLAVYWLDTVVLPFEEECEVTQRGCTHVSELDASVGQVCVDGGCT